MEILFLDRKNEERLGCLLILFGTSLENDEVLIFRSKYIYIESVYFSMLDAFVFRLK